MTQSTQHRTLVLGNSIPVLGEILKRVAYILVIFWNRALFSHINGKLSPIPFE